ncbi:MAG: hypothetical protein A2X13_03575 [Bacteroidetes bacterium GWC2_33_15]|nr:MAG: hypothetical protein A2X10_13190 [Bacteroidetes bacterium GWA2_33_15]OFX51689.1 MAG: hypothetical protein A2X13_03575 [Bacteroidetes bacterium GWC2_33_15]OFX66249.1 MAG: hypothetical protein A2X15_14370 [Bacteroidetes bacterium GWB2_32_14]OFX66989.1 MAG: hypothetical protein A2X14_00735 [Bacteroidetes bacterium GWD2_33_33]HAN17687.1 DUF4924 domain-containing protein [Bacteroidales bacterium]
MIIAREKKKENIAEYILYMWQIEHIIRVLNLDIEKIYQNIIIKFDQPDSVKNEMKSWYLGLISMMKEENKTEKGHLQILQNTINDLYNFHLQMLNSDNEQNYVDTYNLSKPGIDDLVLKSNQTVQNEIEACFNGLYGLLMFRMQNKTISPETAGAMNHISRLIALLSKRYKQFENGEIEI